MANMNFTARESFDIVCCLHRNENQLVLAREMEIVLCGTEMNGMGMDIHLMGLHSPERMTNGNISLHGESGNC